MVVLPPGTLLQLMYLDERLKRIPPGRFIEIGPGSGEITRRLLNARWSGTVYDLSGETIARLRQRFDDEIASGRLVAIQGDFLEFPLPVQQSKRVDLVISCMVMEHLDDAAERRYIEVAAHHLREMGQLIGLVPASPNHWGIEDDIAGHCRRYTKDALLSLFQVNRWKLVHVAGLTYPVSNLLLPISNILVKRHEESKLGLSSLERTKHSGRRNVQFKTHFPAILKILLNERILLPLYWLQKCFVNSDKALVLYFEAIHESRSSTDGK